MVIKRFFREISDYLFGNYTEKDYKMRQGFAMEFLPRQEADRLIEGYRREALINRWVQTSFSAVAVYGMYRGYHDENAFSTCMACSFLAGKALFYLWTKLHMSNLREEEKNFKMDYLQRGLDDPGEKIDGEEWKFGTDYPFSRDSDEREE